MRILNLRFSNLNSFENTWYIDFEHPAYSQESLFLLTGATGAGKTTILDAISLALYGETPRQKVSEMNCEVMNRKARFCDAEVTFSISSGRRFVAKWSQERSKGQKPFSKARHELSENSQILNRTATDTKKIVEQYTGLDFEQFKRVVILAQGEFAAFLKAKPNEKSQILEKLTNTSIYTRLSEYLFKKCSNMNEEIENLATKLSLYNILNKNEILEKQLLIKILKSKAIILKKLEQDGLKKKQWLFELEKLKNDKNDLDIEKAKYDNKIVSFKPILEELELAKLAEKFTGEFGRLTELRRQMQNDNLRQQKLQDDLNLLKNDEMESQKAVNTALEDVKKIQEIIQKGSPVWDKVLILDATLQEKNKVLKKYQQEIKDQQKSLYNKNKELASRLEDKEHSQKALEEIVTWINEHQADAWLIENLEAVKDKIANFQTLALEITKLSTSNNHLLKEINELDSEAVALKSDLEKLKISKNELKAKIDNYLTIQTNVLSGKTLEDLRKIKDEKAKALLLSQKLEEHRAELQDGKPCPLCGAAEHPYAAFVKEKIENLLSDDLKELTKRLEQAEKAEKELQKLNINFVTNKAEQEKIDNLITGIEKQRAILFNNLEANKIQNDKLTANLSTHKAYLKNELIRFDQNLNIDDSQNLVNLGNILQNRKDEWQNNNIKKSEQESIVQKLELVTEALSNEMEDFIKEIEKTEQNVRQLNAEYKILREERLKLFGNRLVDQEKAELDNLFKAAQKEADIQNNNHTTIINNIKSLEGSLHILQTHILETLPLLEREEISFSLHLQENNLNEETWKNLLKDDDFIRSTEAEEKALTEWEVSISTRIAENNKVLEEKTSLALTQKNISEIISDNESIETMEKETLNKIAILENDLQKNSENIEQSEPIAQKLKLLQMEYKKWSELNILIGSSKGHALRNIAQRVTLNSLLNFANIQLAKITQRYELITGDKNSMDLKIIDHIQADEIRPITNLSGGETFIVSLALALGLSSLAGKNVRIDSLFLDEGFGSLDKETLNVAINAIEELRQEDKLIGIISHVEELKDRIQTQIRVSFNSRGSRIEGSGCELKQVVRPPSSKPGTMRKKI